MSESEALGDLIPMAPAARLIGVSPSTIWRWARDGVQIGDERVYLPCYRLGRRIWFDSADIRIFAQRSGKAQRVAWDRSRGTSRSAGEGLPT